MNQNLVKVWESYERNGDQCIACATEEQAWNHGLFEVESVYNVEIYLTNEGKSRIEKGEIIFA